MRGAEFFIRINTTANGVDITVDGGVNKADENASRAMTGASATIAAPMADAAAPTRSIPSIAPSSSVPKPAPKTPAKIGGSKSSHSPRRGRKRPTHR